jgi:hexosaminidase
LTWIATGGVLHVDGFRSGDDAFGAVAALAERRGLSFAGEAVLQFIHNKLAGDAYVITITTEGVSIEAGDYGGRFYACITLLTLLQHGPLQCGVIKDAPRFGWRGQHLDTARHYYQPETILDLLDLMALLKLNRFHWHFADDEAFRIELESLPELWQQTRMCGEAELLPALFAGSTRAGGSYDKATVRDVIEHANQLNIEILPEIEAPAHALALTHVFPDTRDPADNGAEMSVQGYVANTMNPAMPQTWEVLEKIVAEVADLFPFNHLHLGCDELAEGAWMGSPKARTLMQQEGLSTTDDLQGWMMHRLGQIAMDQGQRPAAWEEAAKGGNGGLGHDAILFSWTGQGPGLEAARNGYDVVMTPAQHVYLDMAHSDDPDDWGASWAAFIGLVDTVNWTPVPDPELAEKIIGVQGTFWSEFTTQDWQIWPMLLPRMLGVAAMAWQQEPPTSEEICKLASASFLKPSFMSA